MQEKNRYLLSMVLVFIAGLFISWYGLVNWQLYSGIKNLEGEDSVQKEHLAKIEALFTDPNKK